MGTGKRSMHKHAYMHTLLQYKEKRNAQIKCDLFTFCLLRVNQKQQQ